MTFETEQDLAREKRAIELFVSIFKGSYKKLDPLDIDYKVFDKSGALIAYAEVKGLTNTLYNAFPLSVPAKKVVKLVDKRLASVLIWACEDGIVYGKVDKLIGHVKWGANSPHLHASNPKELMIYYDRQKEFKYVRYS
jgi:hypothetical protein